MDAFAILHTKELIKFSPSEAFINPLPAAHAQITMWCIQKVKYTYEEYAAKAKALNVPAFTEIQYNELHK